MSTTTEPRVIAGRYQLEEPVGSGASGVVWRARDLLLERPVAVKLLRGELADDAEARERLRIEARAAATLTAPGVARVYDYGTQDDDGGSAVGYLVMELVEGPSLREVLSAGPLTERRTMELVAQVAATLAQVHDLDIVHRDVKPGNILLAEDGTARITDFGIARVAHAAPLTRTGTLVGTAQYLAPERALGHGAVAAADVYALGVIAHECLTGSAPFVDESPVAVALAHATGDFPALPDGTGPLAADLVRAMTRKEPDQRPTAADVAARARAAAQAANKPAGATTTAMDTAAVMGPEPTRVLPTADRPRRRWPRSPLAIGAALLLLAAGVGLAAATRDGDRRGGPVTVPSLTGTSLSRATTALEVVGLVATVRQREVAGADKDEVTAQNPAPGTTLDEGSAVVLTAATGSVTVREEDYVGKSFAAVSAALEHLGLAVRRGANPNAPTSAVTTGLAPDGSVRVGTTVVVDVRSTGSATKVTADTAKPSGGKAKGASNGKGKPNGKAKGKKKG